jgi:hypothetical protein
VARLGYARECPDAKWKPNKKKANTVQTDVGTTGYGNLLPIVLLVCHSPDWWIDTGANIVFFLSGRACFLLIDGEHGACGCTWCWYCQSEAYFGEDRVAEERASCPLNKE